MKLSHALPLLCSLLLAQTAFSADLNKHAFTLEVKQGATTSYYGTGTLVRVGNDTYYVSAHHIFGKVPDTQIQNITKSATIVNEIDKNLHFKPEAFIAVPNVQDLTKTDFLILKLRSNLTLAKYALPLASVPPQKDEVVYLAARLPNKPLATYPLKVQETSDDQTVYEKIPNVDKYTGASGGPIINSKNEIVGTYLGRQLAEDNSIRSLIGTPHSSLKTILESVSKAH